MDLCIGIDIGSTTTKIIALIPRDGEMIYSDYQRHNAKQLKSLEEPFIQEVVANSIALKHTYENVGTAIELGGQDAKVIFCCNFYSNIGRKLQRFFVF